MKKNLILIFLILIIQVFLPQNAAACELQPDIAVVPTSIDFGSVDVGTNSAPVKVTLTNEGDANLVISAISIVGTDPSQFSIISVEAISETLAPGESASGFVQFNPTSPGDKIACIYIRSNDPDEGCLYIVMQGRGIYNPSLNPDITVDPTSIDFGPVYIGTSSAPRTVTVTNDGNANLFFSSYGIGGTNASQFAITSINATSAILPPGASVSGAIQFNPTYISNMTAYLRFYTNDPDENPFDVPLTGVGTDVPPTQPDINVFPVTIDFGAVELGSLSATQNVTVSNTGMADLNIGNLSINDSQFLITSGNISGQVLGPGTSENVSLVFTPASKGAQAAMLTIPSDDIDENPVNVVLSGTGTLVSHALIWGIVFDDINADGTKDFGESGLPGANVSLDGSDNITTDASGIFSFLTDITGVHTLKEINPGGYHSTTPDQVNIDVVPGNTYYVNFGDTNNTTKAAIYGIVYEDYDTDGFQDANEPGLSGANVSLDGSDNITTDASGVFSFATDVAGIHMVKEVNPDGYLSTTDDVVTRDVVLGNSYQIDFGDVLEKPDIFVIPMSIDFGSVLVDSSSTPVTVEITNHGGAELILGSLSIVGTDIADFNIVSDNASTVILATGQSANVSVQFSPLSTGDKEAALQIPSNDEDESNVHVLLSGTGSEGLTEPEIEVTPLSLDFGAVEVGSLSATQNVTVSNAGSGNLVIGDITIDDSQFFITSGNISGQMLGPGASADISLVFAPLATGVQTSSMAILSNDTDESIVTVSLNGSGTEALLTPDINVTPLSINFGTINVGLSSAAKKVTVSNNGTADLHITGLAINNSQFTITAGNLSGQTLVPGASAEISLVFTPSATGLQSGTLTISSNDPDENPVTVGLTGTGYIPPGPPPPPPPPPTTTTTTLTPMPEGTGSAGSLYFTVDFLGEITREPASNDGRPLYRIAAPDPDGIHLLEIEAGTGARDSNYDIVTLIEIRETSVPMLPANTRLIGKAYEFMPSGTVFDMPVRLTLGYNVDELPENVTSVGTAYYSPISGWTFLETEPSNVAELGKVKTPVNHFTVFAVLAKVTEKPVVTPPPTSETIPETGALPVGFKLSNLRIVPSVSKVFSRLVYFSTTGEEATISVDVTNEGGQRGTYAVTLKLNQNDVETKEITLESGKTQTVTFTVTTDKQGTYTVQIGELKGEFSRKLWINIWLCVGTVIVLGLLCWYIIYRVRHKDRTMII